MALQNIGHRVKALSKRFDTLRKLPDCRPHCRGIVKYLARWNLGPVGNTIRRGFYARNRRGNFGGARPARSLFLFAHDSISLGSV